MTRLGGRYSDIWRRKYEEAKDKPRELMIMIDLIDRINRYVRGKS